MDLKSYKAPYLDTLKITRFERHACNNKKKSGCKNESIHAQASYDRFKLGVQTFFSDLLDWCMYLVTKCAYRDIQHII